MSNADPRDMLLDALATRAYVYDPSGSIPLASGGTSSQYIDCKSALSDPAALSAAAELLAARLLPEVEAVGGLTMGADPLATGVALRTLQMGRPRCWFSVRKDAKAHGRKRLVEGLQPGSGRHLAVFDDVVTRGESTLDAIRKCRGEGHQVVQILALVDREAGGLAKIQEEVGAAVPVAAIFRLSEVHAAWQARHPSGGSRFAV
jgi:orotate phosphoribosyltransferase